MKYTFTKDFFEILKMSNRIYISIDSPNEYRMLMKLLENHTRFNWNAIISRPTSKNTDPSYYSSKNIILYPNINIIKKNGQISGSKDDCILELKNIIQPIKITKRKLKQY